ncbi:MAG: hypothetical protein Q6361_05265 [Candidatus Hermodarchaeota archaeon]|jgi:hypothetical protein|nr:hypothetical protein [Candidatus Hermodarchaeota archaeon]
MTKKPAHLQHPDFNLEAILALLGVLLGFLFIVVIYLLENPNEALSTWGVPLILFLVTCYALGLTIIATIISHEVSFYLANKLLEIDAEEFPQIEFTEFKRNTQRSLRQIIKLLLYFIFGFGLFLINLASFAAAKIFYSYFIVIEDVITLLWGPGVLLLARMSVMFVVQFVLIIPFAKYQGYLWDLFQRVERITIAKPNSKK